MDILFLTRWFPYPADNGSKIRIYNLLREISARHTVDLVSFREENVRVDQVLALRSYCRRVESVPYRAFQPAGKRALSGFFSWQPRSVVDTFSPEMAAMCEVAAQQQSYDLVIASQVGMIPYASRLPVPCRVAEEIEVSTLYDRAHVPQKNLRWLRGQLTWIKYGSYLRRMLADFQGCTVVSEHERDRLLPFRGSRRPLAVIPNGVDLEWLGNCSGQPDNNILIYNGALTYQANYDAVAYFLAEIFPLIRARRPAVKLLVTGKTEGVDLSRLPTGQGVVFTGYLADVRPAVVSAWASVVPLRVGGGTRLKILESMALGTPVVATRKGAEGLEATAGRDILLADRPEEFAGAVLELLDNTEMRSRISAAGRALVEEKYDWKMIGRVMNDFIEALAREESRR